jgi:hypothetical protein
MGCIWAVLLAKELDRKAGLALSCTGCETRHSAIIGWEQVDVKKGPISC